MKSGIKCYNANTEGEFRVSKNFRVCEFAEKDQHLVFIADDLVQLLQCIRDVVGKPVHLTNAYRSYPHNKLVGGAADSRHMYGAAADIYVSGMNSVELAKTIRDIVGNAPYGVGLYSTFVHVDTYRKSTFLFDSRSGTAKQVTKF